VIPMAVAIVYSSLVLKRASASRPSGEWNDDDYDVLADGTVVGRIFKANAAPVGSPWMWTLAFGHHEDRTPAQGYAPTREAAMSAFAKSWRRGVNNDDARHRSLGGVFSLMRRSKVRFRGQTGKHWSELYRF
jgi:hypothetical protein